MDSAIVDAHKLYPWIAPAVLFGLFAFVGLFLKKIIFRYLRSALPDEKSGAMSLLLDALDRMFGLWLVLAGISAAAASAPLSANREHLVHVLVRSGFLITATLAAVRVLTAAASSGQWFGTNWALANVISNLGRLVVVALGTLLVLSNVGVSITPLLTALGVTSLAVALALQDLLGNFFAGIHLVLSKTIQRGEHIKLDSGQEGNVIEVGWRATTIKDPSNNVVIIPNIKLSQAILTNFYKPDPEIVVPVALSVPWEADLAKVEKIVLDEAAKIQRSTPGAAPNFAPQALFSNAAESNVLMTVSLRARTASDRPVLIHEFLKHAQARLKREGIPPPYPRRVVETRTTA